MAGSSAGRWPRGSSAISSPTSWVFGKPMPSAVRSPLRYFSAHCCRWKAGDQTGMSAVDKSASADRRSPSALTTHLRTVLARSPPLIEDAPFVMGGMRDRTYDLLATLELLGRDHHDVLGHAHRVQGHPNFTS